jgi:SAM-dependent methyltransferase
MNDVDDPQFWENIYLEDDAGWDLNGVTPIFETLSKSLTKGNVCFLGSGRGYDAVQFAKMNFDVTAVDFAPSAIKAVNVLAKKSDLSIQTIQDDIFSLTPEYANTFDLIIEQTCFCAIHPSRRKDYEKLAKSLLKPSGKLIGLWFPLDKKTDEGGPPWGTTINEVKSIFNSGWSIEKEEFSAQSIAPRKGREKLIIFKKC